MNAKMLRAILENVHDDVDIWVTINGYDEEVGAFFFNEDEGYIALQAIEKEEDYDEDTDNDGTFLTGDTTDTGTSCDLPEVDNLGSHGIRDL